MSLRFFPPSASIIQISLELLLLSPIVLVFSHLDKTDPQRSAEKGDFKPMGSVMSGIAVVTQTPFFCLLMIASRKLQIHVLTYMI